MLKYFLLALGAAVLQLPAQAPAPQRAILVTGASSGIGRKITERLASHGFFVYAGARSQKDLDDLGKIPNVKAVRLDVTVPTDISAAVATVRAGGRGLYGIVNNAGVVVIAPLIEAEEKELDYIFNVNIYGPYRITKAFAPLVIDAKGRIVNISSLNGIVASPMIGAYSMSKHAIEAFGDGLAAELRPLGVHVSLIEPGNYGTEIGRNLVAHTDTSAFATSRFAPQLRATLNSMSQFEKNPPPDDVADAVLDAFTNDHPRLRYLVVPVEVQARIPIRKKFDDLVEMNESQKFRYDRDALVKMLDDAIARAKAQRP
jgi:NAD(P)-dependent dehydrogenase (short-subunit alcohol dehydrogenase family)